MISVKAIGISTPPVKPLQRAQHDHLREVLCKGTRDRQRQKQECVGQQVNPHRKYLGEPATQGNHDNLGDQVGG